jgi:hypothetical protein
MSVNDAFMDAYVAPCPPLTLETSAAMYLAQKALLKKYGANAITITPGAVTAAARLIVYGNA